MLADGSENAGKEINPPFFKKGGLMNMITRILKALRAYGADVLLLGFLEKLLGELIEKFIALQTAVKKKKAAREARRS